MVEVPAAVVTGIARVEAGADPLHARWERKPPRLARMDRLCGLALLAAEGALRDGGLVIGAGLAERFAVVVGTAFGCHAVNEDYYRGLIAEGPSGASPRLFAYTLPSSPLGEVTIHLGARGPAETLVSGRHAGLEAVGRAAALCESGRVDAALVIAVEVATPLLAALGVRCEEGAVALLVESEEHAARRGAAAHGRLAAAASAFAGVLGNAEAAARVRAGLAMLAGGTATHEALVLSDADGAMPAMVALADWFGDSGGARATLVLAVDPHGGAAGLLVEAGVQK